MSLTESCSLSSNQGDNIFIRNQPIKFQSIKAGPKPVKSQACYNLLAPKKNTKRMPHLSDNKVSQSKDQN